jgi:hypothetical protein
MAKGNGSNGSTSGHLRELILGIGRGPPEPVENLTLGGEQVYIRSMTGAERDEMEQAIAAQGTGDAARGGWRGRVLAGQLCDSTGERLFTFADSDELNQLDSQFTDKIIDAAMKFNRFGQQGVEEAEKNSEPAQNSSSTSDSPSASTEP